MMMPTPAALIVVPTRELGVQTAMLLDRLLGGGIHNPTLQPFSTPGGGQHVPGDPANLFTYKGPRKVGVAPLWDEQTLYAGVYQDMLKNVVFVVGTPELLGRAASSGEKPCSRS